MATTSRKSAQPTKTTTSATPTKRTYTKKATKVSASKKGQSNVQSSAAPIKKVRPLYISLLSVSSEAKEQQELLWHVEDKKSMFLEDLRQTNRALENAKRERNELISSKSLTSSALSAVDQKIEGLERGVARLEGYINELF